MPTLPRAQLPSAPTDATGLHQWATNLIGTLLRTFSQIGYIVNAMLASGTLASRPATPVLNDTLFFASDTQQGFFATADAWSEIGGPRPRRGRVTANGVTTSTVTLSPVEADANYGIWATAVGYNSGVIWVTGKAAGQFVLNWVTAGGATDTIQWLLLRDA